jgi:excisionase family DNA binding protein
VTKRIPAPQPTDPLDLDALADQIADRLAERVGAHRWPPYLSIKNGATYSSLSEDALRGLLSGGKLTAYRPVGGRVVISRAELDALIKSSTRQPRRRRGGYDRAGKGGNGQ